MPLSISLPSASTNDATNPKQGEKAMLDSRKPRVSADFAAGFLSGVVCRLFVAPFDVLKIRFQLQQNASTLQSTQKYTSIAQAFRLIVRDEGVLSLWKGNWPATFLWVTFGAVQFGSYGFIKSYLDSHSSWTSYSSMLSSSFIAGGIAGTLASGVTYPFDIMRTQFAIQGKNRKFESQASFVRHLYNTNGVRGFFVGALPALVGTIPYMGLNFAIYEYLKVALADFISNDETNRSGSSTSAKRNGDNAVDKDDTSLWWQKIINSSKKVLDSSICGAVSGGISKLAVYPLDTVKRRIQSQILANTFDLAKSTTSAQLLNGSFNNGNHPNHPGQLRYKGMIDCGRQIVSSEGILGLYKGLLPSIMKAVSSTAIAFASYEYFLNFVVNIIDD